MASFLFDVGIDKMADALFDWSSLDARILLLDGTSPAPVASKATVTATLTSGTGTAVEAAVSGYVRKALASKAITDSGSTRIFTAASPIWTALGTLGDSLGGAILFAWGGSDATSWPIGFYAEANQLLAGSDYEFSITTAGLLQLAKA